MRTVQSLELKPIYMAAKKSVGYAKYRLSPLKKITDLAKQIRKQHPNMKYTDAVKKAGVQYRAGKNAKPSPRKAAPKKKAAVKKVHHKKTAHKKTPAAKQGQLFGIGGTSMYSVRDNFERDIKNTLIYIDQMKKNKALSPTERKKWIGKYKKHLQSLREQLRKQNAMINQSLR